jgi:hypothetical protein
MPPTRAAEFDGNLAAFGEQYAYQRSLTPRLDDIGEIEFTQGLVNEIVLWKVNRFVCIDAQGLRQIEATKHLNPGEHRRAKSVLGLLLDILGVDLPMASTLLRFRNPAVFQIIDRHAYRALYGTAYPLHATTARNRKIATYFTYLDDLRSLCHSKGLLFETVDRVLYVFDKETNGSLKKTETDDT